jgi:hypothetical protein
MEDIWLQKEVVVRIIFSMFSFLLFPFSESLQQKQGRMGFVSDICYLFSHGEIERGYRDEWDGRCTKVWEGGEEVPPRPKISIQPLQGSSKGKLHRKGRLSFVGERGEDCLLAFVQENKLLFHQKGNNQSTMNE